MVSKVVKDIDKNLIVIIGYTKSEFYDPKKKLKKGSKKGQYRDAISLSLLHIHKVKNEVKYSYPDKFVIDHPNFCKHSTTIQKNSNFFSRSSLRIKFRDFRRPHLPSRCV